MRKNSIKNIRINEEVLRTLSHIINRELKDPRIGEVTSVTAVDVTPDLKECKVYISVMGDSGVRKQTGEGLESAKGFIRRTLAKELNLRNTPELKFIMDDSIEYGVSMSHYIDEVNSTLTTSEEENEE